MANEKLFTCNFTFLILGRESSHIGDDIVKLALSLYERRK